MLQARGFQAGTFAPSLHDCGFVAAKQLQAILAINGGQTVSIRKFPIIDKTVMTRGALKIDPHEDLRNILRGLQGGGLARIDDATPNDPLGEPFTARNRVD